VNPKPIGGSDDARVLLNRPVAPRRLKVLGRKLLNKIATIFTPDKILRSQHRLIAMKWTFTNSHVGRPGLMKEIPERSSCARQTTIRIGLFENTALTLTKSDRIKAWATP